MAACGSVPGLHAGQSKCNCRASLAPSTQFLRLSLRRHAACPWRRRAAQHPRQAAVTAAVSSTAPGVAPSRGCPVQQFIAAFNARDLDGMAALLAEDCIYHNLAQPRAHHGKQEVRRVLQTLLATTPTDWQLLIEDSTAPSSAHCHPAVGISWRMVARGGKALPLLSGLSFYKLDPQGRICFLKESAESALKVPESLMPLLGSAAPLLQMLGSPTSLGTPGPEPAAPAQVPAGVFGAGGSGLATPGAAPVPGSSPARRAGAGAGAASHSGGSMGAPLGQPRASRSARASSGSSASNSRSLGVQGPAPPAPASQAGVAGSQGPAGALSQLEGVFLKDLAASDMASYERALKLMQIGGLQRTTAMQLLEGLEVEQKGDDIALRFLTVVPFFKITEPYSLAGTTSMQRRDLKAGRQTAAARLGEGGASLIVDISWPAPNAGSLQEVYKLSPEGALEVTATIRVAAGSEVTRQVYRRAEGWAPKYRWPGF